MSTTSRTDTPPTADAGSDGMSGKKQSEPWKPSDNWLLPAEQWIPAAIQMRLTEIEALVQMLVEVTGVRREGK
jgi:hypothetical protein